MDKKLGFMGFILLITVIGLTLFLMYGGEEEIDINDSIETDGDNLEDPTNILEQRELNDSDRDITDPDSLLGGNRGTGISDGSDIDSGSNGDSDGSSLSSGADGEFDIFDGIGDGGGIGYGNPEDWGDGNEMSNETDIDSDDDNISLEDERDEYGYLNWLDNIRNDYPPAYDESKEYWFGLYSDIDKDVTAQEYNDLCEWLPNEGYTDGQGQGQGCDNETKFDTQNNTNFDAFYYDQFWQRPSEDNHIWNERNLFEMPYGDDTVSIYPLTANTEDSELVSDAHVTIHSISPHTEVWEGDRDTINYINNEGQIQAMADYRPNEEGDDWPNEDADDVRNFEWDDSITETRIYYDDVLLSEKNNPDNRFIQEYSDIESSFYGEENELRIEADIGMELEWEQEVENEICERHSTARTESFSYEMEDEPRTEFESTRTTVSAEVGDETVSERITVFGSTRVPAGNETYDTTIRMSGSTILCGIETVWEEKDDTDTITVEDTKEDVEVYDPEPVVRYGEYHNGDMGVFVTPTESYYWDGAILPDGGELNNFWHYSSTADGSWNYIYASDENDEWSLREGIDRNSLYWADSTDNYDGPLQVRPTQQIAFPFTSGITYSEGESESEILHMTTFDEQNINNDLEGYVDLVAADSFEPTLDAEFRLDDAWDDYHDNPTTVMGLVEGGEVETEPEEVIKIHNANIYAEVVEEYPSEALVDIEIQLKTDEGNPINTQARGGSSHLEVRDEIVNTDRNGQAEVTVEATRDGEQTIELNTNSWWIEDDDDTYIDDPIDLDGGINDEIITDYYFDGNETTIDVLQSERSTEFRYADVLDMFLMNVIIPLLILFFPLYLMHLAFPFELWPPWKLLKK